MAIHSSDLFQNVLAEAAKMKAEMSVPEPTPAPEASSEPVEQGLIPESSSPEVSEESKPQTIKFKANGTEQELTIEEATKRLSLAEGARKAMQDKALLEKKLKSFESEMSELKAAQEELKKFKELQHDPRKLYEAVSGGSYEDFVKKELKRRQVMEHGSESEKLLLAQEEELEVIKRQLNQDTARRQADIAKAERLKEEAQKERLHGVVEREFSKYKVPEGLPAETATKLQNLVWKESIQEAKAAYQKEGKLTKKMLENIVKSNAESLYGAYNKVNDSAQKTVSTAKKTEAASSLASAVENKLDSVSDSDGKLLNPLDLFRKRFKR